MSLKVIKIRSGLKDYNVRFQEDSGFIAELVKVPNALFIIDSNVWEFHKDTTLAALKNNDKIILEISEDRKSLVTVQELYDKVVERVPKKNMVLVVIGGGILQDIAGFAASTLYRGISWVFLPTTLLAQTDSCIGSKTSLNYKAYKNLIGTFYPPAEVHIFTGFLSTLKDADYFSGLGEMAKLCMIGGKRSAAEFAGSIARITARDQAAVLTLLQKSLLIKKDYIESDEYDSGRRNVLNFGHCFGHALESAANFAIPHGLAVVAGILMADSVAGKRGLLSGPNENYFAETLLRPILKFDLKSLDINAPEIISAMKKDKKRTGTKLALVLIKDDFQMERVSDLEESEAAWAVEKFKRSSDVLSPG